jgi:hypothetical protein
MNRVNKRGYFSTIERPGDGLALITHFRFGQKLWALCKTRSRKTNECVLCGNTVGSLSYRPITNGGNRMDRICVKCVEK